MTRDEAERVVWMLEPYLDPIGPESVVVDPRLNVSHTYVGGVGIVVHPSFYARIQEAEVELFRYRGPHHVATWNYYNRNGEREDLIVLPGETVLSAMERQGLELR